MVLITPLSSFDRSKLEEEDYAVFGGTFDPVHEGHLIVVRSLKEIFPTLIIAPTTLNPWKKDQLQPTSQTQRLEMMQLVLGAENLSFSSDITGSGIILADFAYNYSRELVSYLRSKRRGVLYWAVGEDLEAGVGKWQNWEELNVPVLSASIVINSHSTMVREGKLKPHPAIKDYILQHRLYQ